MTSRSNSVRSGAVSGTFSTFKLWVAIRELLGDLALCCWKLITLNVENVPFEGQGLRESYRIRTRLR